MRVNDYLCRSIVSLPTNWPMPHSESTCICLDVPLSLFHAVPQLAPGNIKWTMLFIPTFRPVWETEKGLKKREKIRWIFIEEKLDLTIQSGASVHKTGCAHKWMYEGSGSHNRWAGEGDLREARESLYRLSDGPTDRLDWLAGWRRGRGFETQSVWSQKSRGLWPTEPRHTIGANAMGTQAL